MPCSACTKKNKREEIPESPTSAHRCGYASHARAAENLPRLLVTEIPALSKRCMLASSLIFFFNDTATTEIYTLSLHDALPIYAEHGYTAKQQHQHECSQH